jgi:hypothetical protein
MKLIALASLVAPSLAFVAPSTSSSASSTLIAASAFENEVGAQAPLGFYDPFGVVAEDGAENFSKWREIELKHGR